MKEIPEALCEACQNKSPFSHVTWKYNLFIQSHDSFIKKKKTKSAHVDADNKSQSPFLAVHNNDRGKKHCEALHSNDSSSSKHYVIIQ